jgi:transposase
MNYLGMSLQQSIVTLRSHGWSFRRIARELGIRRETVSKYVRQSESLSKPAKVPTGSLIRTRSQCEPWRDPIEQALQAGLSAQRIYW